MHCRKKKQRGPAAASQQLGVLLYISSQKSVTLIEFTVKTLLIAHNWSGQAAQSERDTRCLSSCHHTSIIILIEQARLKLTLDLCDVITSTTPHPTPAGRAGAVGSEGLFVMKNLC